MHTETREGLSETREGLNDSPTYANFLILQGIPVIFFFMTNVLFYYIWNDSINHVLCLKVFIF